METLTIRETTKDNPARYKDVLEYFSALTGISKTKILEFDRPEKLRTTPHKYAINKTKTKLRFPADGIRVVDKDGNQFCYIQGNNKRYSDCGIEAVKFLVEVVRPLKEFGVEYQQVGTYKECEGGGWYSNTPLYKHDKFYFIIA